MTSEAQRVAIAEACGWKELIHGRGIWHHAVTGKNAIPKDGAIHKKRTEMKMPSEHFLLPDYPNDLNSCHAAYLTLTFEQRLEFTKQLIYIQNRTRNERATSDNITGQAITELLGATAAQWAEALVRTFGLWKD